MYVVVLKLLLDINDGFCACAVAYRLSINSFTNSLLILTRLRVWIIRLMGKIAMFTLHLLCHKVPGYHEKAVLNKIEAGYGG